MKDYKLTMTLTVKEFKDQLKNWDFKKAAKNYELSLLSIGMYADNYNEYVEESIESLTDLTIATFLDEYVENVRILLEEVDDLAMFLLRQSKIINASFNYFSNTEGSYVIETRENWSDECLLIDIYELDVE